MFCFGLDLQTNKQKILTGNNHFCSQGRAEWPGATYDTAKPWGALQSCWLKEHWLTRALGEARMLQKKHYGSVRDIRYMKTKDNSDCINHSDSLEHLFWPSFQVSWPLEWWSMGKTFHARWLVAPLTSLKLLWLMTVEYLAVYLLKKKNNKKTIYIFTY